MDSVLYITPVSGVERAPDGRIIPDRALRNRIARAVELIRSRRGTERGFLSPIGGLKHYSFGNKAHIAWMWIRDNYPDIEVGPVLAMSYCTARDMVGFAEYALQEKLGFSRYIVVSESDHGVMAQRTLTRSRLKNVSAANASESNAYRWHHLIVLIPLYWFDPCWNWLAWPLRWAAYWRETHDQPKPYTGLGVSSILKSA